MLAPLDASSQVGTTYHRVSSAVLVEWYRATKSIADLLRGDPITQPFRIVCTLAVALASVGPLAAQVPKGDEPSAAALAEAIEKLKNPRLNVKNEAARLLRGAGDRGTIALLQYYDAEKPATPHDNPDARTLLDSILWPNDEATRAANFKKIADYAKNRQLDMLCETLCTHRELIKPEMWRLIQQFSKDLCRHLSEKYNVTVRAPEPSQNTFINEDEPAKVDGSSTIIAKKIVKQTNLFNSVLIIDAPETSLTSITTSIVFARGRMKCASVTESIIICESLEINKFDAKETRIRGSVICTYGPANVTSMTSSSYHICYGSNLGKYDIDKDVVMIKPPTSHGQFFLHFLSNYGVEGQPSSRGPGYAITKVIDTPYKTPFVVGDVILAVDGIKVSDETMVIHAIVRAAAAGRNHVFVKKNRGNEYVILKVNNDDW